MMPFMTTAKIRVFRPGWKYMDCIIGVQWSIGATAFGALGSMDEIYFYMNVIDYESS